MFDECYEIAENIFNAIKQEGSLDEAIKLAKSNLRGLRLWVEQQLADDESNTVIENVTESLREMLLNEVI